MTKKERIEDLGRLAVELEQMLEWDIFEEDVEPKFLFEAWKKMVPEERHLYVRHMLYGRDAIRLKLQDLSYLASGKVDE